MSLTTSSAVAGSFVGAVVATVVVSLVDVFAAAESERDDFATDVAVVDVAPKRRLRDVVEAAGVGVVVETVVEAVVEDVVEAAGVGVVVEAVVEAVVGVVVEAAGVGVGVEFAFAAVVAGATSSAMTLKTRCSLLTPSICDDEKRSVPLAAACNVGSCGCIVGVLRTRVVDAAATVSG